MSLGTALYPHYPPAPNRDEADAALAAPRQYASLIRGGSATAPTAGGRPRDPTEEQFEELVLATKSGLERYCASLRPDPNDAADLSQDALVRAIEKFGMLRTRHPAVFLKWVRQIAKNVHLAERRRRAKTRYVSIEEHAIEPATESEDVLEQLTNDEIASRIRGLINQFDDRTLITFQLRMIGGKSWVEIGNILDAKPDTVRSWVERMCESIRDQLAREM